MAWADLTAEQKDIVQENDKQLRAAVGMFARSLELMANVISHYDAEVETLLTSNLALGEEIPQASGLAGVASQTRQEYENVIAALKTAQADENTSARRETYAKLAGPVNIG